ncbi:MAG: hypothetical protein ACTSR8_03075 [Promethearchaeota archaeon]
MEEKIEIPYWESPFNEFDENENHPIAMIMDLSDIRPGELELEEEIKMGYLWKKYKK